MVQTIYEDGTYLASNPNWHAEDSPWKAKYVLQMMQRHHLKPSSIAEVGCGVGEILNQLSRTLPEASFVGFDISPAAIESARKRENSQLQFFCEDLGKSSRHFDVLLMMDVVEHVEDCWGFLRSIRDKAQYKIMHIPLDMALWLVFRNRVMDFRKEVGHIHYFSKDTALALLNESGYKVIDWFYTPGYEINFHKQIQHKAMGLVRKTAARIAPDATAMLLGGFPLMVLAE